MALVRHIEVLLGYIDDRFHRLLVNFSNQMKIHKNIEMTSGGWASNFVRL